MNKILIFALLQLAILGVITYFLYIDFGWVISLTASTIILLLLYIIDLMQAQAIKIHRIAKFLDYQFDEGYIDEANNLHKKGQPSIDLSKEDYEN